MCLDLLFWRKLKDNGLQRKMFLFFCKIGLTFVGPLFIYKMVNNTKSVLQK